MKIAIIGSGGREHALAHQLSNSKKITKIYSIPGFPFIGSSSLGKTLVKGSKRVPKPARGIIACLIIKMFYL